MRTVKIQIYIDSRGKLILFTEVEDSGLKQIYPVIHILTFDLSLFTYLRVTAIYISVNIYVPRDRGTA